MSSDPSDESAVLTFPDNDRVRELVGQMGGHLTFLSQRSGLKISQRGNQIFVAGGSQEEIDGMSDLLDQLYGLIEGGLALRRDDVSHGHRILTRDPNAELKAYFQDTILVAVDGRRITPRSAGQRSYLQALRTHDIVFGVGPAGTGKTYLAMAVAIAALKRGDVERLILTRPAVEAGEKLGFLPGDLTDKVDPYLRPLYDALEDMLPAERVARMLERRTIEVAPLAFMRGRTLKNAAVVLDEAQNTTRAQMRMFLTRLGPKSKMVITGDVTQVDLPSRSQSGMLQALRVLQNIPKIGVARLTSADVVRHPLVGEIIDAYANNDQERE